MTKYKDTTRGYKLQNTRVNPRIQVTKYKDTIPRIDATKYKDTTPRIQVTKYNDTSIRIYA